MLFVAFSLYKVYKQRVDFQSTCDQGKIFDNEVKKVSLIISKIMYCDRGTFVERSEIWFSMERVETRAICESLNKNSLIKGDIRIKNFDFLNKEIHTSVLNCFLLFGLFLFVSRLKKENLW